MIVRVTFDWDDHFGTCYDCGTPAAYTAPERYGEDKPLTDEMLLCAICAVKEASEGGRIVFLFHQEDIDGELTDEHRTIIAHYNSEVAR